jgi:hypothetical protein
LPFYNNSDGKGGFLLRCFKNFLISYSFCSKREKAHCRKLEKLFSERDSHNGNAPENSAAESGERNFPAENDYPKDVEKSVSETDGFVLNFLFERKGAKPRNFKTLNSRGNSDYAYAKEKTRSGPFQPEKKSAENEPKKVSQSFH